MAIRKLDLGDDSRRVRMIERVRRMSRMRAEGMTYRAIGEAFGVSATCIHQTLKRSQARLYNSSQRLLKELDAHNEVLQQIASYYELQDEAQRSLAEIRRYKGQLFRQFARDLKAEEKRLRDSKGISRSKAIAKIAEWYGLSKPEVYRIVRVRLGDD